MLLYCCRTRTAYEYSQYNSSAWISVGNKSTITASVSGFCSYYFALVYSCVDVACTRYFPSISGFDTTTWGICYKLYFGYPAYIYIYSQCFGLPHCGCFHHSSTGSTSAVSTAARHLPRVIAMLSNTPSIVYTRSTYVYELYAHRLDYRTFTDRCFQEWVGVEYTTLRGEALEILTTAVLAVCQRVRYCSHCEYSLYGQFFGVLYCARCL